MNRYKKKIKLDKYRLEHTKYNNPEPNSYLKDLYLCHCYFNKIVPQNCKFLQDSNSLFLLRKHCLKLLGSQSMFALWIKLQLNMRQHQGDMLVQFLMKYTFNPEIIQIKNCADSFVIMGLNLVSKTSPEFHGFESSF